MSLFAFAKGYLTPLLLALCLSPLYPLLNSETYGPWRSAATESECHGLWGYTQ